MSALPPQRQIKIDQVQGAPQWLAGLLVPLNKILGALYDIANKGTSTVMQLGWQYQTLQVSVTNGTWVPQKFKVTAQGTPRGVIVVNTVSATPTVGAIVVNSWSVSGDQLTIDSLTGLGNGKYSITLLVTT